MLTFLTIFGCQCVACADHGMKLLSQGTGGDGRSLDPTVHFALGCSEVEEGTFLIRLNIHYPTNLVNVIV